MDVPGVSVDAVITRLERQRDVARADVERLKEERDVLRQRLRAATEMQVAEHARLEKTAMDCGERMHRLETERRELLVAQGMRKAALSCMEEQCETLSKQLSAAQSELASLQELYNKTRTRLDRSERGMAKTGGDFLQATTELACAQQRIRDLEKERMSLDKQVASLKNDNTLLRGSLAQVEQERQCLLMNNDVLTENVGTLEQDLKAKEHRILNAEESAALLQAKIDIIIPELVALEQKLRDAQQALRNLKPQLDVSERSRISAEREVSRLKNTVNTLSQNLDTVRKEVEALRQSFQDLFLEKEDLARALGRMSEEKNEMLEQFRKIAIEAKELEESNQKLEKELQAACTELKESEVRVEGMLQEVRSRDETIRGHEGQISELKEQMTRTNSHLARAGEQVSRCENQKDVLLKQLADLKVIRHQQQLEFDRMAAEEESLRNQMKSDQALIESLEGKLQKAKQEVDQEKATNKVLQCENSQLSQNVSDLNKLIKESDEVRKYSRRVADLSRELADVRRGEGQQGTRDVATTSAAPETRHGGTLVPAPKWEASGIVWSPTQSPTTTVSQLDDWTPRKVTYPGPAHRQWPAVGAEQQARPQLTAPDGFKRVHSTFTSTGPLVAAWHANYSVVRCSCSRAETTAATGTTTSTNVASDNPSTVQNK